MDVSSPSESPDPTKIATALEGAQHVGRRHGTARVCWVVMELAQRKREGLVTMDYI